MIRNFILATVLGLSLVACGDGGMSATDSAATDSQIADGSAKCSSPTIVENSPGSCLWSLPAGPPCASELVSVNGKVLPADSVDIVCGAGTLVIRDTQACHDGVTGVVAVYSCE